MKRNLLIVSSNAMDMAGLCAAFSNLEEIALLPPATGCKSALAAVEAGTVELLLLDLVLKDGDGFAVLDALEKLEIQRRPLVFAMTPLTDERLLYAIRDRVVFCFAKPLLYEQVALRVLQLMRPGVEPAPSLRPDRTLDRRITERLMEIGVPAHLNGYYFLRDAIRMYARAETPLKLRITRDVYPVIAAFYSEEAEDLTPCAVENAMRTAIEFSWTHGSLAAIHKYFGYTVSEKHGRPSNAEFVMLMAEHVRIKSADGGRSRRVR